MSNELNIRAALVSVSNVVRRHDGARRNQAKACGENRAFRMLAAEGSGA